MNRATAHRLRSADSDWHVVIEPAIEQALFISDVFIAFEALS